MNKLLFTFVALIFYSSCGKIENSNSLDEVLYGVYTDTGSPQFLAAKAAINAHCLNCHGAWKRYSEQDFIDGNLVVRGSPKDSKLFYRNILATEGDGPRNMPSSGYAPISAGDLLLIYQWISAL